MKIAMVLKWSVFGNFGGTERVMCVLASELAKRGHSVTILCADRVSGTPAYPIHPQVKFQHYGRDPSLFEKNIIKLRSFSFHPEERRFIRGVLTLNDLSCRLMEKIKKDTYDVYISFSTNTSYILLGAGISKWKIVTMFHNAPEIVYGEIFGNLKGGLPEKIKSISKFKRAKSYFNRYVARISDICYAQVLMPEFIEPAKNLLPNCYFIYIPNPVPQYSTRSPLTKHTIINVSRILPLKRQDLIIDAFSLVSDEFPDWGLEFWGQIYNNGYYEFLKEKIKEKKLIGRVCLCGVTAQVDVALDEASIFVIASEFEGFCLALLEAMSKGLPVIGTENCSAVNSLILHQNNGLLCDDSPEALARSFRILMKDALLRKQYGNQGVKTARRYSKENITNDWEHLLTKIYDGGLNTEIK